MRSLHDIPSFTMQVEYNNVRIQDEFIYGMISNSTSVGGFKGMTGKDVRLDDGVFEVTLIKKPRNPIELNEIIASLINLVDDTDMIYSFKSDEVEFMAPVFAGDYIEAVGEIVSVGNTSRKMVFEARKVIAPRPDINDSACDVLEEPIVVCRASGTCVVPKDKQRK